MKEIKYKKRKHQTDMTNLSILFHEDQRAYQKLARAMHWITARPIRKRNRVVL